MAPNVYHCSTCDRCFHTERSRQQHWTDSSNHNYCSTCDRHFIGNSQLQQHMQVHVPRDIECWGCDKTFKSASGIFIHLESGACPSGLDREILDTAIDQHYLWDEDEEAYDQLCCYGCDKMFSSISRWLQHIESPACSEDRELNERVAVNVVGTVLRGLRYDYNLVLTDMYGYDL